MYPSSWDGRGVKPSQKKKQKLKTDSGYTGVIYYTTGIAIFLYRQDSYGQAIQSYRTVKLSRTSQP